MNHTNIISFLSIAAAFGIIVTASGSLSVIFKKIKLPAITGFIIVGILSGPYLLKMLPGDLHKIEFINDIALAFIAFASGAEIYLKEIRDKIRDISIMSASQFFITFIVSFVLIMAFSGFIPFMQNVDIKIKIAISLLISTIFIARSPASAIAIINELRAKGRFTKIALGVTIIKDIFVIVLFAITFSIADVLVTGNKFDVWEILIVFLDLILSFVVGYIFGKLIEFLFRLNLSEAIEAIILLLLGWLMFILSHKIEHYTDIHWHYAIHIEALLVGIIAAFFVTNYTKYRLNLQKTIENIGPYVYATFFTFIGATISLDILLKYWAIAFLLFGIRLVAVILASISGSILLKDSLKNTLLSWTPYITQAGVSLGLITIVASRFLNFGVEFEAILIAVIIINQFVGPPLMKYALISVGEAHIKSDEHENDYHKNVFIFGIGGKAIMLAKTLLKNGYTVNIITDKDEVDLSGCTDVSISKVDKIDYATLEALNYKLADSAIIFRREAAAFDIAELIYEKFGTPNVIVVLEKHSDVHKFKKIGATVVAPTSALITLLADFVRSPQATQILLGMQQSRETADIEVLARDIHGYALRDIQFPLGILILSITRNGEIILPHGYTRIRLNDIVTVVGSGEQIEIVRTKLQYS